MGQQGYGLYVHNLEDTGHLYVQAVKVRLDILEKRKSPFTESRAPFILLSIYKPSCYTD
jgi:hypothetical protein